MRLTHFLVEAIPEVSPHMYVAKLGQIFKVRKHNFDGVALSATIEVNLVKRMWRNATKIFCETEPTVQTINLNDGYDILSSSQALEIYQLTRGHMKKLATDSAESPNNVRHQMGIDS